ncbi:restriction endonuclease [Sulfurovum sp.]|uniref:restriction endonuclease n=1 Tax=Sulfurovum sp. TaxID=1969726 RepID=UPI002867B74F|nr:restriction endonuclease [Sulfurovum sp.]
MTHYTTLQIQSIALLILFFLIFLYKAKVLFKRFKHKSLLKRNKTLKKLKRLSWDDFELLTMELFSNMGWKVLGNEKKGADGGVDIWMQKTSFTAKNISAIVQCKRYDDALVTIKVIREMYGLMYEYEVNEVYVVTTSRFTKDCYSFTEEKKITLIDGEILVKLIKKYG